MISELLCIFKPAPIPYVPSVPTLHKYGSKVPLSQEIVIPFGCYLLFSFDGLPRNDVQLMSD